MTRSHGQLSKLFMMPEDTFGTPPAGNYHQLAYYTSTFKEGPGEEEDEVLSAGSWDPEDAAPDVRDHAGQLTVPLCLNQYGFWLKQIFGPATVTDEGGGDYTHIWKSSDIDVIPSATVELLLQQTRGFRHAGIMIDGMSLSTERRGGYGQVQLDCVGQSETLINASGAGVPVITELDQTPVFTGSILIDDVAVASITKGDFSYTNSLVPQNGLQVEGLQTGFDRGKGIPAGNLTCRFTDTVMYEKARDHEAMAIEYKWAKGASRSLSFRMGRAKMPRTGVEVNGPGGIDVPYSFTARRDPAETDGRALVVTLKNQIAAY